MRLVFDLDGVFRDLNPYLKEKYGVPYPTNWIWKFKNKDLFEWAKADNYHVVIEAPATEYLEVVKKHIKLPEIWTCQPEDWKPFTAEWISHHIGNCLVSYMTSEEKRKRLDKETDVILVEDYPFFSHYDRIALVDRPYNQQVKPFYRFKNVKEFERLFSLLNLLPLYHKEVKKHLDKVGHKMHIEVNLDIEFLLLCEKRIINAHKKYGEDWKTKDNKKEAGLELLDLFNYYILEECQREYNDKATNKAE